MTIKPHQWTDDQGRVLILKRIPSNRKSYNDFPWPKEQQTFTATDFSTSTSCGGGLHGWPWMFGLGEGSDYDIVNDVWLVLAAKPDDVVGELEGGWKCKAKTVDKIYDGDFIGASALLKKGQHECIIGMASSGEGAKLASSGEGAKLASSGYGAKLASSGDRATLASSGDVATLASSGEGATLASSGEGAKLASSGDVATLASSGDRATLASSGDVATLASSGDEATLASSGYGATLASSGDKIGRAHV